MLLSDVREQKFSQGKWRRVKFNVGRNDVQWGITVCVLIRIIDITGCPFKGFLICLFLQLLKNTIYLRYIDDILIFYFNHIPETLKLNQP